MGGFMKKTVLFNDGPNVITAQEFISKQQGVFQTAEQEEKVAHAGLGRRIDDVPAPVGRTAGQHQQQCRQQEDLA